VLRRASTAATPTPFTRLGQLTIDRERMEARVGEVPLPLTATEFGLLAALSESPNRVSSRERLIDRAMPDSDALERTVDGHLKNLRRKLAEAGVHDLIETVHGIGYRLRPPAT
jgi:two-component system response regulator AdeR